MTQFSDIALIRQLLTKDGCLPPGEIVMETRRQDDDNYKVTGPVFLIIFFNLGQTRLWIDEQIPLDPGAIWIDRNVCHDYSFHFKPVPTPPGVDEPAVYAGNMLKIRKYINSPIAEGWIIKNPGSINATVSLPTTTGGTLNVGGGQTTSNFTIPAGAVKVEIKNVGLEGNGIDAIATYNGVPLPPDPATWKILKSQTDPVTNIDKKLPAINVVTNGAEIWYSVES